MVKKLIVNMKAYREGSGNALEAIADQCIEAANGFEHELVIASQPSDIHRLENRYVTGYAEHIDPVEPGSHTGHVLPEAVKEAGAEGTLLNHSERRLEKDEIEEAVKRAKEAGLETVVCAQSPEECAEVKEFEPDYIAYEPPELIGGDVSVSEAEPEMIEAAVEASKPVPALTGAGIKDTEDVEKSVELGCEGVLVASGVVKAENPRRETEELMEGL
ncbi:MAG: triose-phosphate isomerase [Candidatus Nanohaloarchaea archaeon]